MSIQAQNQKPKLNFLNNFKQMQRTRKLKTGLLLGLFCVLSFCFIFSTVLFKPYFSDAEGEFADLTDEEKKEYLFSREACPREVVDVLDVDSFLEKDYIDLKEDDYESYFQNFRDELKLNLISNMADYYSNAYSPTLAVKGIESFDAVMMEDIIRTNDVSVFLPEEYSFIEQARLNNEIKECFSKDYEIIITVEKAKLNSEWLTYGTNSLTTMLVELQEVYNKYRDEILGPSVLLETDADNSTLINYIK